MKSFGWGKEGQCEHRPKGLQVFLLVFISEFKRKTRENETSSRLEAASGCGERRPRMPSEVQF